MRHFTLIVEGEEDRNFLKQFIQHHFKIKLENSDFIIVGGKSETIHMVRSSIIESTKAGKKNALIFDADDADFHSTLKNIQGVSGELTFNEIFLFPNHSSAGNLETLLSELIIDKNRALLDCIEGYSQCASKLGIDGLRKIDAKSKMVIYHGSFEKSGMAKGSERDYLGSGIWDMNSESLNPLKQFLQQLITS